MHAGTPTHLRSSLRGPQETSQFHVTDANRVLASSSLTYIVSTGGSLETAVENKSIVKLSVRFILHLESGQQEPH